MATTGGNGDKVELTLGSKSLGITTKDLVNVLFVIGAFAGWWLTVQHLSAGQERGFASLTQILETQNAHQATLLALVHDNRKEMVELLTRQNLMVHDQTTALREAVDAQTKVFQAMLETLNWNIGRAPSDRLPLGRRPPGRVPREEEP